MASRPRRVRTLGQIGSHPLATNRAMPPAPESLAIAAPASAVRAAPFFRFFVQLCRQCQIVRWLPKPRRCSGLRRGPHRGRASASMLLNGSSTEVTQAGGIASGRDAPVSASRKASRLPPLPAEAANRLAAPLRPPAPRLQLLTSLSRCGDECTVARSQRMSTRIARPRHLIGFRREPAQAFALVAERAASVQGVAKRRGRDGLGGVPTSGRGEQAFAYDRARES